MAALLTLRLSSPSFLETIITDNSIPVYSTETNASTTTLSRCDPYHGLSLVANVHWPERHSSKGKCKDSSPAQISMDGSIRSEDDLLKRNRLNTSRKFRIPGHSESLKWRRVQGIFQCVSSSGAPIAVFEPAHLTAAARLSVFVPTLSGLPQPQGCVSWLLVDYLIVTAMLLLTHPEDWHGFAPSASASGQSATMPRPLSLPRGSPPPSIVLAQSPPASPLLPISMQQQQYTRPLSHSRSLHHLASPAESSFSRSSSSIPPSPRLPRSHSPSRSLPWDSGSTSSSSVSGGPYEKGRLTVVNDFTQEQQYYTTPAQQQHYYPQAQRQQAFDYNPSEMVTGEEPPPYEQHQFTVRIRQNGRRGRATAGGSF